MSQKNFNGKGGLRSILINLRAKSFTSLKTDLRQDINGGFGKLTQKRRFVFVTLLI